MKTFNEQKEMLLSLCQLAADGKLHFRDFDAQWPSGLADSSIANIIQDDIEEAVEHFPTRLLSNEPDWKMWKNSEIYFNLLIDIELLKQNISESTLLAARQTISNEKNISLDKLSENVIQVIKKIQKM